MQLGCRYHALRIQGYAYGARGLEDRLSTASDVGIADIDSQHQGFFKAAHRRSVLTRAGTNEELGPAAKAPARRQRLDTNTLNAGLSFALSSP